MRFLRKGGIYRSDVGSKPEPKSKSKPNPGAGPTAPRWSAPGQGKRTRREDHALLIVRDEFRTGYSSIGLLASRARLRFTGIARISAGRSGEKELSSNGEVRIFTCLTQGVHPNMSRSHECERCTHECVRHDAPSARFRAA